MSGPTLQDIHWDTARLKSSCRVLRFESSSKLDTHAMPSSRSFQVVRPASSIRPSPLSLRSW